MVTLSRFSHCVNILIECFRFVASLVVFMVMPLSLSSLTGIRGWVPLSGLYLPSGLHFGAKVLSNFLVVSRHFCGCVQPRFDASLHDTHTQKFVSRCLSGTLSISSISCFM